MNTNLTAAKTAKKDNINSVIQACNDVLEYKNVVNDLGRRVEAIHYGIDDINIGTLNDIFFHCSESLSNAEHRFDELKTLLNGTEQYTDITLQMNVGWDLYHEVLWGYETEDIKKMSSEDVLAIRSIMGQVELLRDTLIWSSDEHELNRGKSR